MENFLDLDNLETEHDKFFVFMSIENVPIFFKKDTFNEYASLLTKQSIQIKFEKIPVEIIQHTIGKRKMIKNNTIRYAPYNSNVRQYANTSMIMRYQIFDGISVNYSRNIIKFISNFMLSPDKKNMQPICDIESAISLIYFAHFIMVKNETLIKICVSQLISLITPYDYFNQIIMINNYHKKNCHVQQNDLSIQNHLFDKIEYILNNQNKHDGFNDNNNNTNTNIFTYLSKQLIDFYKNEIFTKEMGRRTLYNGKIIEPMVALTIDEYIYKCYKEKSPNFKTNTPHYVLFAQIFLCRNPINPSVKQLLNRFPCYFSITPAYSEYTSFSDTDATNLPKFFNINNGKIPLPIVDENNNPCKETSPFTSVTPTIAYAMQNKLNCNIIHERLPPISVCPSSSVPGNTAPIISSSSEFLSYLNKHL